MSKYYKFLCATLCAYSTCTLVADTFVSDEALFQSMPEATPDFSSSDFTSFSSMEASPSFAEPKAAAKKKEVPFSPFTGKIKGRKVRMRLSADLDSKIIKELSKNQLVSIIGEKGDFWEVQPPPETKVYVFRSFVLDNVIEGNRVNVRLEPNLEAPVVAHLNAGDRLENPVISPVNTKWLEITPPPQTCFYIAKDYVENAGGPELKAEYDRRLATAEQLLDATSILSQSELRKSFNEINFDRIVQNYNTVINDYSDFSELAEHAKEALAAFQDTYLEKRITYLENKPSAAEIAAEAQRVSAIKELSEALAQVTDKMRIWEPVEEGIYQGWAALNENKDYNEFYDEQKLSAMVISGIVEAYNSPVKNKPGDYIIRDKDRPVAYVYSTRINLQGLVGKQVTLAASARSNNNFAFPAYYVLGVE
ncbi:MAG: SH3 domain-containing protein [Chlamydiota bacterium]